MGEGSVEYTQLIQSLPWIHCFRFSPFRASPVGIHQPLRYPMCVSACFPNVSCLSEKPVDTEWYLEEANSWSKICCKRWNPPLND